MVAVAPRWFWRLTGGGQFPPLGRDVWGETWIEMEALSGIGRLRHLLTGEMLGVETRAGVAVLPAKAVLRHFSVALLVGT